MLGNGNPGSDLIEKRQAGRKLGIETYNKVNGTTYTFDPFLDSEFFYAASSAWARAERLYPYPIIHTGGELVTFAQAKPCSAPGSASPTRSWRKSWRPAGSTTC